MATYYGRSIYSAWTEIQYTTTATTNGGIYSSWLDGTAGGLGNGLLGGTYSNTYDSTTNATVWRYWNQQSGVQAQLAMPHYETQPYWDAAWNRWNQEIVEYERRYMGVPNYRPALEQQALAAQAAAQRQMAEANRRALRDYERQFAYDAEAAKRHQKEKAKVEATAVDLLMDLIGEEQRVAYEKTGTIIVQGKKHRWMLTRGGKVRIIGRAKTQAFCISAVNRYQYPDTDNVIALLLAIASNESDVLKTANKLGKHALEVDGIDPKTLLPKGPHAVADLQLAA